MTEKDIQLIIERAREQFLGVKPRIISDHGKLAGAFCQRFCHRFVYQRPGNPGKTG